MTTRTRATATPLYPGSFYPEEGPATELTSAASIEDVVAALDNGRCFAIEVRTVTEKLWTDGEGGEMWLTEKEIGSYRIYFGTELTADDVPGPDFKILRHNMVSNGWKTVVRTRAGNYQPVEASDVVVPA